MVTKILDAIEVWEYWEENRNDILGRLELIAEHEDFGIEIYLTADCFEGPDVEVYHDGVRVYNEYIYNEKDCIKTINKVYDEYLTENPMGLFNSISKEDDEEDEKSTTDEAIEEREEEIDNLVYEFCIGLMEHNQLTDEGWEDVKEHFLEYLHRKHGVSIYRPMYLEDENGEEFFEEYPYEHMVFDDEDNPLYK